ncbi:blue light receptor [Physocladia obscura]|uniref:Blue light receptor n=1 Tax=Physocladia obscura TaxID=109957 RepID=A0AAD5T1A8_9FUNG|nr:blue light receptor [Physocladia obscura]
MWSGTNRWTHQTVERLHVGRETVAADGSVPANVNANVDCSMDDNKTCGSAQTQSRSVALPPTATSFSTCFWALVATDSPLSFLFAPIPTSNSARVNLLSAIHPNDVVAVMKELDAFMVLVNAGDRDALAGCAVRCRYSFDQYKQPATVRPFLGPEVVAGTRAFQTKWSDVEIGFNAANRDCLLVFVHAIDECASISLTEKSFEICPQDVKLLRELMIKQSMGYQCLAKPNIFLTIVGGATQSILYTSLLELSTLRSTASNHSNSTKFESYLSSDSAAFYLSQLSKKSDVITWPCVPKIFSFQHGTSQLPNLQDHESVFLESSGLIFIVMRLPLSASITPSPQLKPGCSKNFPEGNITEAMRVEAASTPESTKRTVRPWEDNEVTESTSNEEESILDSCLQARTSPVLNNLLLKNDISQAETWQHNSRYLHAASDPMTPLLAAVQSIQQQQQQQQRQNQSIHARFVAQQQQLHPHHNLNCGPQKNYGHPLPNSSHQQQQLLSTQIHSQQPPAYVIKQMHYDSPQISPPSAPLRSLLSTPANALTAVPLLDRKSAKGLPTISKSATETTLAKEAANATDEEINSPPSNFGEERSTVPTGSGISKSRPMKPGNCRKCGKTASREWRKGPHGPKTLCNACGLRFKRKPWELPNAAMAANAPMAMVTMASTAETADNSDGNVVGDVGSLMVDIHKVHIEVGVRAD